ELHAVRDRGRHVGELAAVGKRIGRDVDDAGDARAVELERAAVAVEGDVEHGRASVGGWCQLALTLPSPASGTGEKRAKKQRSLAEHFIFSLSRLQERAGVRAILRTRALLHR